jgi:hypothetical protein
MADDECFPLWKTGMDWPINRQSTDEQAEQGNDDKDLPSASFYKNENPGNRSPG